jgi:hypothetical protein
MSTTNIFFENNDELLEMEALHRGYRNDVYVQIDGNFYKMTCYDTVRIIQDFDTEYKEYGYYATEPNLILLKEVTTNTIVETILKLVKQDFFKELGSYNKCHNVDCANFKKVYSN